MPSGLRPAVGDVRRIEPTDHHDLEQRVEHRADRHRREDRARQIALGISRLARELDRLLEALQPEHDAAGQRREHAVEAERHEAAAGVEVGRRRTASPPTTHDARGTARPSSRPRRTMLLSDRNFAPARLIAVNTIIKSDRDDEPGAVEQARIVEHVEVRRGPTSTLLMYVIAREHLDRRDEHRLQPRRPAGGEAGDRAVAVVGDARGAARDRIRRTELGVRRARAATASPPRGSTTGSRPGRRPGRR